MIYRASPYYHEDKEVRIDRLVKACFAAAELMKREIDVFSPIAHSHPVSDSGMLADAARCLAVATIQFIVDCCPGGEA